MSAEHSNIVLTGNTLVSFSSDTSAQERDDILDALTYTEILAGEKFNRRERWAKWVHEYQLGLYANGFLLSAALKNKKVSIDNPRDLPNVAATAIEAAGYSESAISELRKLARSALDTMLRSKHAQVFFRNWFYVDRSENFQVVPCMKNYRGEIDIMVCGMQMISKVQQVSWFQRPSSDLTVSVDGGAYLYSKLTYDSHRERVATELTKRTRTAFQNF